MATGAIFNIATDEKELAATNFGIGPTKYDQVQPQSDYRRDNFAGKALHLKWSQSSTDWHDRSRFYINVRCKLTKGDGVTPLTMSDNIAPAMGLMSNVISKIELKLNDKIIETVTEHVGQLDAHRTRKEKTDTWMETYGATQFWQSDFRTRQAVTASDSKVNASDVSDTVVSTSSANLTDDAGTNQLEITADTIVLTKNAGADLQIGNYVVGDIIYMTVPSNINEQYVISEVTNDDVNTTVLTFEKGAAAANTLAAAFMSTNAFLRNRTTSSVGAARNVSEFEIQWVPPLSFFRDADAAVPGGGDWELVITPQPKSSYKKRAIESVGADKTAKTTSADNDFDFEILDLYAYTPMVQGPRVDDLTYYIDMEAVDVLPTQIKSNTFLAERITLPATTNMIGVTYQDTRAGEDSRIPVSRFITYDDAFAVRQELKLNRLMLTYAGQSRPSPDADPEFATGKDNTTRLYYERMLHNGQNTSDGGLETIEKWHNRGSEYFWTWPKDGKNNGANLTLYSGFELGTITTNMNSVVFAHYRRAAKVTIKAGKVVDVTTWDR